MQSLNRSSRMALLQQDKDLHPESFLLIHLESFLPRRPTDDNAIEMQSVARDAPTISPTQYRASNDNEETRESTNPSLLNALLKTAGSVTPNDFIVALEFFLASYYVANLPEYAENHDGASIALIAVISHTCIRLMISGFQLPAGFAHFGITFDENGKIKTDPSEFLASMRAMIRAGIFSSIPGMALFLLTPLLYKATGTSQNVVNASYHYISIAFISMLFQNLNTGFQQTLLKLEKNKRMLQAAFLNAIPTSLIALLIVFGNPVTKLKAIQALAAVITIGSAITTLGNIIYFHIRNQLPKPWDYLSDRQKEVSTKVFQLFIFEIGSPIFFQMLSELGAIYLQPFLAKWFLPAQYLDMILAVLSCTSNINLFAIVPAITISQAAGSTIDTYIRKIRNIIEKENRGETIKEEDGTISEHCENIRKTIKLSFLGMLAFSTIINIGLLTLIAPGVTSLFGANNINMPGIASNPYFLIGTLGVGTTIDYLRNLALFVLRALDVNKFGSNMSWFCLYFVNIVLLFVFSQIKNIEAFGILAPYYLSFLLGTVLLWQRVAVCTADERSIRVAATPKDTLIQQLNNVDIEGIEKSQETLQMDLNIKLTQQDGWPLKVLKKFFLCCQTKTTAPSTTINVGRTVYL